MNILLIGAGGVGEAIAVLTAKQDPQAEKWEKKGLLALLGSGVEPGMVDVFAQYATDHLFDEIHELNIRDADNLCVEGLDIAFGFSIWTTIEECLNPPVIWVKGKKDGLGRSVYLYNLADNEECMKTIGSQAVVAQTAFNPVIMMELIAKGIWKETGVLTPEFFPPGINGSRTSRR